MNNTKKQTDNDQLFSSDQPVSSFNFGKFGSTQLTDIQPLPDFNFNSNLLNMSNISDASYCEDQPIMPFKNELFKQNSNINNPESAPIMFFDIKSDKDKSDSSDDSNNEISIRNSGNDIMYGARQSRETRNYDKQKNNQNQQIPIANKNTNESLKLKPLELCEEETKEVRETRKLSVKDRIKSIEARKNSEDKANSTNTVPIMTPKNEKDQDKLKTQRGSSVKDRIKMFENTIKEQKEKINIESPSRSSSTDKKKIQEIDKPQNSISNKNKEQKDSLNPNKPSLPKPQGSALSSIGLKAPNKNEEFKDDEDQKQFVPNVVYTHLQEVKELKVTYELGTNRSVASDRCSSPQPQSKIDSPVRPISENPIQSYGFNIKPETSYQMENNQPEFTVSLGKPLNVLDEIQKYSDYVAPIKDKVIIKETKSEDANIKRIDPNTDNNIVQPGFFVSLGKPLDIQKEIEKYSDFIAPSQDKDTTGQNLIPTDGQFGNLNLSSDDFNNNRFFNNFSNKPLDIQNEIQKFSDYVSPSKNKDSITQEYANQAEDDKNLELSCDYHNDNQVFNTSPGKPLDMQKEIQKYTDYVSPIGTRISDNQSKQIHDSPANDENISESSENKLVFQTSLGKPLNIGEEIQKYSDYVSPIGTRISDNQNKQIHDSPANDENISESSENKLVFQTSLGKPLNIGKEIQKYSDYVSPIGTRISDNQNKQIHDSPANDENISESSENKLVFQTSLGKPLNIGKEIQKYSDYVSPIGTRISNSQNKQIHDSPANDENISESTENKMVFQTSLGKPLNIGEEIQKYSDYVSPIGIRISDSQNKQIHDSPADDDENISESTENKMVFQTSLGKPLNIGEEIQKYSDYVSSSRDKHSDGISDAKNSNFDKNFRVEYSEQVQSEQAQLYESNTSSYQNPGYNFKNFSTNSGIMNNDSKKAWHEERYYKDEQNYLDNYTNLDKPDFSNHLFNAMKEKFASDGNAKFYTSTTSINEHNSKSIIYNNNNNENLKPISTSTSQNLQRSLIDQEDFQANQNENLEKSIRESSYDNSRGNMQNEKSNNIGITNNQAENSMNESNIIQKERQSNIIDNPSEKNFDNSIDQRDTMAPNFGGNLRKNDANYTNLSLKNSEAQGIAYFQQQQQLNNKDIFIEKIKTPTENWLEKSLQKLQKREYLNNNENKPKDTYEDDLHSKSMDYSGQDKPSKRTFIQNQDDQINKTVHIYQQSELNRPRDMPWKFGLENKLTQENEEKSNLPNTQSIEKAELEAEVEVEDGHNYTKNYQNISVDTSEKSMHHDSSNKIQPLNEQVNKSINQSYNQNQVNYDQENNSSNVDREPELNQFHLENLKNISQNRSQLDIDHQNESRLDNKQQINFVQDYKQEPEKSISGKSFHQDEVNSPTPQDNKYNADKPNTSKIHTNILDFEKSILEKSVDVSHINLPDMANPYFNPNQSINTSTDNILQRPTADFEIKKKNNTIIEEKIVPEVVNEENPIFNDDEMDDISVTMDISTSQLVKGFNNKSHSNIKSSMNSKILHNDRSQRNITNKHPENSEKCLSESFEEVLEENFQEEIELKPSDKSITNSKSQNKSTIKPESEQTELISNEPQINQNVFGVIAKPQNESIEITEKFSANFLPLMSNKKQEEVAVSQEEKATIPPKEKMTQKIIEKIDEVEEPVNNFIDEKSKKITDSGKLFGLELSVSQNIGSTLNVILPPIEKQMTIETQDNGKDSPKVIPNNSDLSPSQPNNINYNGRSASATPENTKDKSELVPSKNISVSPKQKPDNQYFKGGIMPQGQSNKQINEEFKSILDQSGISAIQEKSGKWKFKLAKEVDVMNLDDMKLVDFEKILNDQSEISHIHDLSHMSIPVFRNMMFGKDKDSSVNTSYMSQKNEAVEFFDYKSQINYQKFNKQYQKGGSIEEEYFPPKFQNKNINEKKNQKDKPEKNISSKKSDSESESQQEEIRSNAVKKKRKPSQSSNEGRGSYDGQRNSHGSESSSDVIKTIEKLKELMRKKGIEGIDLDQLMKALLQDGNQPLISQRQKPATPRPEKNDDTLAFDDNFDNFTVKDMEFFTRFLDVSGIQPNQFMTDDDFLISTNISVNRAPHNPRTKLTPMEEKEFFKEGDLVKSLGSTSPISKNFALGELQKKLEEIEVQPASNNSSPKVLTPQGNLNKLKEATKNQENDQKKIAENLETQSHPNEADNEKLEDKLIDHNVQATQKGATNKVDTKTSMPEVKEESIEESICPEKVAAYGESFNKSFEGQTRKNSLIKAQQKEIREIEVQTDMNNASHILPIQRKSSTESPNLTLLHKSIEEKDKSIQVTVVNKSLVTGEIQNPAIDRSKDLDYSMNTRELLAHVDHLSTNVQAAELEINQFVNEFRLSHMPMSVSKSSVSQSNHSEEKNITPNSENSTSLTQVNPLISTNKESNPSVITVETNVEVKEKLPENSQESSSKEVKPFQNPHFQSDIEGWTTTFRNLPRVEDAPRDSKKIVDSFFDEYFGSKEKKNRLLLDEKQETQIKTPDESKAIQKLTEPKNKILKGKNEFPNIGVQNFELTNNTKEGSKILGNEAPFTLFNPFQLEHSRLSLSRKSIALSKSVNPQLEFTNQIPEPSLKKLDIQEEVLSVEKESIQTPSKQDNKNNTQELKSKETRENTETMSIPHPLQKQKIRPSVTSNTKLEIRKIQNERINTPNRIRDRSESDIKKKDSVAISNATQSIKQTDKDSSTSHIPSIVLSPEAEATFTNLLSQSQKEISNSSTRNFDNTTRLSASMNPALTGTTNYGMFSSRDTQFSKAYESFSPLNINQPNNFGSTFEDNSTKIQDNFKGVPDRIVLNEVFTLSPGLRNPEYPKNLQTNISISKPETESFMIDKNLTSQNFLLKNNNFSQSIPDISIPSANTTTIGTTFKADSNKYLDTMSIPNYTTVIYPNSGTTVLSSGPSLTPFNTDTYVTYTSPATTIYDNPKTSMKPANYSLPITSISNIEISNPPQSSIITGNTYEIPKSPAYISQIPTSYPISGSYYPSNFGTSNQQSSIMPGFSSTIDSNVTEVPQQTFKMRLKLRTQKKNIKKNQNIVTKEVSLNTTIIKPLNRLEDDYSILKPNMSFLGDTSMIGSQCIPKKLFGFTKKNIFYRDNEDKRATSGDIELMCINCEEFVILSNMEKHKKVCQGMPVKKLIDKMYEENPKIEAKIPEPIKYVKIADLNNKLVKILHLFTDKVLSLQNRDLLLDGQKILNIAHFAAGNNENLEQMQEAHKILNGIYSAFKNRNLNPDEIFLLILLQRLLVIIKEKEEEIDLLQYDSLELIKLQSEIKAYEKEAAKQKAELEIWKYQADILDEVKKNDARNLKYVKGGLLKDFEVLSQIHSDVDMSEVESNDTGAESDYTTVSGLGSVNDLRASVYSGITSNSFNSSNTMGGYKPSVSIDPAKREASKRQFYAEACNLKLALPPNHPAKDILISELYDECLKAGIKQEDWSVFLKSRFQIKV